MSPHPTIAHQEHACLKCEESILYLPIGAGRDPVAVDRTPDPERGDVALLGGLAAVLPADRAAAARAGGVEVFVRHAVTCPFGRGR